MKNIVPGSEIYLHYSEKPMPRLKRERVPQINPDTFKPEGIWITDDSDENWAWFCRREKFRREGLRHVATVYVDPTNLLYLRTPGELDSFTREYSYPAGTPWRIGIDWNRVSEKYDGIMIFPYQWSRRLSGDTSWYYGWDCASGCIWDGKSIKKVRRQ